MLQNEAYRSHFGASVNSAFIFYIIIMSSAFIMENKRYGYADDSTLIAVVSSSGVGVAEFLHRDPG